jgi:cytochrome P450
MHRRIENAKETKTNKGFSFIALRRHYTSPHEYYNALRSHDSIYFDASSQCWLVTGHKDVCNILDNPRFSSGLGESANIVMASIRKQMVFMDGAEHLRVQGVMLRPLAQLAKEMPKEIRRFARSVIEMKKQDGEMDMVSDYASLISLMTIARVLGIPTGDHEHLLQLEKWSDTFGDVTSGYFQGDMKDMENIRKLEDYFRGLITEKKRKPAGDLLSSFIASENVFPTEEDLVANCMMVFAAGRLTTKKLIGNSFPYLFAHWEKIQKEYKTNPQRLAKVLGEELLRFITPTRYLMRLAVEDVDLTPENPGKHVIRKGERLLLFLEAANYDPELFSQPEEFDSLRRPNKHIAFGFGKHQCPGATIARLEIQIALEILLSLFEIYPKPGTVPTWNPNPNLGGYSSYPACFRGEL